MSRKVALAVGGFFLGVFAVWALVKVASSGYAFGQHLAERDNTPPAAEAQAAEAPAAEAPAAAP